MSGKLKIRVDTSEIDKADLLPRAYRQRIMRKIASAYFLMIRKRTKKGEDVEGNTFKPYSTRYRNLKERAGRMKSNYWLRLTGELFRSQKTKLEEGAKSTSIAVMFDGDHHQTRFRSQRTKSKGKGKDPKKAPKAYSQPKAPKQKTPKASRAPKAPKQTKYARETGPLTVTETTGKKIPNSIIAWAVDNTRPFVGVNKKELDQLHKFVVRLIRAIDKSGK